MDEVEQSDQLIIINKGEIQAQDQSSKLCEQHKVESIYQLYFALTQNTEAV
jgi:ABC-type multidrug transport system ATPase subunit